MEPTLRSGDAAALVRLLADEDPRIYEACRRRLRSLGPLAAAALASAENSEDARVRVRARALLEELRFDALEAEASELAAVPDACFDLERGAMLLVRAVVPGYDPAPWTGVLAERAEAVRPRLANLRDGLSVARAFGRALGVEQAIRVEDGERSGPRVCLLSHVLERRTGTALAVSEFYLVVAKRLGLPLTPVALPTGVLLRFGPARLGLCVDASRGGRVLDQEECAASVEAAGQAFQPDAVVEIPERTLLARSAAQLAFSLRRGGDRRRAQRLGRLHGVFRTGGASGVRRPGGAPPTGGA